MDTNLLAVATLVVVALIFDYINGFHDAANSIARTFTAWPAPSTT